MEFSATGSAGHTHPRDDEVQVEEGAEVNKGTAEEDATTVSWGGLALFVVISAELDAPPTEKGPGFLASPTRHRAVQTRVVGPAFPFNPRPRQGCLHSVRKV